MPYTTDSMNVIMIGITTLLVLHWWPVHTVPKLITYAHTRQVVPDPDIQAPELLQQLFDLGAAALLRALPDVWAGQGTTKAQPQVGVWTSPRLLQMC